MVNRVLAGELLFLDDDKFQEVIKFAEDFPKTRFGNVYNPTHVDNINALIKKNEEYYKK